MESQINHQFKQKGKTYEGKDIEVVFVVFYDTDDVRRYIYPYVEAYTIIGDCYIPAHDEDYEKFEKEMLKPLIGEKQLEDMKSKVTREAFEYLVSE